MKTIYKINKEEYDMDPVEEEELERFKREMQSKWGNANINLVGDKRDE
jgi:hypothetical protein